ncbi:uncharacterized protein [Antennarius striatus]|uniref:uncharacterized protein n=1 Tax=Antennarius striatus TaxID=241820 RepID=UPI0035B1CA1F
MGSSCCHAESPCGSEEEKSVLLKGDSKAAMPTGEKVMMGTCGPENDGMRITPDEVNMKVEMKAEAEQVKQSPEDGETEPNNTQENGPLQEVNVKTTMLPPEKGPELKENSITAQDEEIKDIPADSVQADLLQCTFNSLQKQSTTGDWEIFTTTLEEENAASAQDETLKISSLTTETSDPENHTETEAGEHIASAVTHEDDDAASPEVDSGVTESSGDNSEHNEVLSVPNTQLPAAVCQLSPISVVSQEIDAESQSCPGPEDLESLGCKECSSELVRSHDVSESPSGPDPTGLGDGGEEQRSRISAGEADIPALEDLSQSSESDQNAKPEVSGTPTTTEVTSSENLQQDSSEKIIQKERSKDEHAPTAEEIDETEEEEAMKAPTEAGGAAGEDAEIQEVTGKEEQLAGSSPAGGKPEEISVAQEQESAEDLLGNSEEDLYRGAEELSASQEDKPGPPHLLETTSLKLEDRCSLAPAMDILSYSEREWRGNTAKSALIRKGYKEMSQRFSSLRRVRGDNYCALRATLFQVLTQSTRLPLWLQEDDISMLPDQLEGLVSHWTFPGECLQGGGTGDATLQLKGYVELLRNKWQAAVNCSSVAERQQLCERAFQGGEEELALLEAMKLLMLDRAAELHGRMQAGKDVPLFCWLLFARDSSDCPHAFLSNHLSHVGLSAGLEQVEMFLLGYALQCTIQVYRLYKADTEEFVTFYPDDHKDDWPSVCLVTEDDRHYNVPIVEAAEHKELDSS